VAIALHLLSALGLYWLAASGISIVGYVSSGATLLLTILRPAIRGYQYLAQRLRAIREQITYPRQDILELRSRFSIIENELKSLAAQLNPNNETSFVVKQEQQWQELRRNYNQLRANLEHFQAVNEQEHEKINQEAKKAIAQLTEDSQFLEQVREIIRFFKQA
jgi:chromosome segregation ATPase